MKKIIFLINFMIVVNVRAQMQIINTPFWKTQVTAQPVLNILPIEEGVQADCEEYIKYLFENSANLKAEDVEFYRNLPLRKQMKDTYEVNFAIGKISDPGLVVDFSSMNDLKLINRTGSLSEISKKMGLNETQVELIENRSAIKIKGRDLVCDLLRQKAGLSVRAQLRFILSDEQFNPIKKFYTQVEAKTIEILNQQQSPYVKAALLGYEYSELLQQRSTAPADVKKNLGQLFVQLFKPNSLEFSSNWLMNSDPHLNLSNSALLENQTLILKAGVE